MNNCDILIRTMFGFHCPNHPLGIGYLFYLRLNTKENILAYLFLDRNKTILYNHNYVTNPSEIVI